MRTTLRGHPVLAAPGKLFLVGEYAVLDGGTAVVAAVNRHAVGQFIDGLDDGSPVITEAVRVTTAALGEKAAALPQGSVLVDTEELSAAGQKLGLGSSAATAAVSVAALLEVAGVPIARETDLLFSLAESAHRAAQGGLGSGADVAACVYGGLLAFSRPAAGAPVIRKLPPLDHVELVVFSAGRPSSTVDRVRAVQALAQTAPDRHAAEIAPVRRAADQFVESMASRQPAALYAAVRAANRAMAALGRAAEVSIVTDELGQAAALAEELGGAAKPSGAGGGDVGIAFLPDRAAAAAFAARAPGAGITVLDIRIDPRGTHRRLAGTG
ncbi:MAG TPA: hypothetical protein VFH73_22170 [Polyangia bacterium]|jgi:phosphomevalonate kinase|nr:hypothetical protein [Polyangia bacterium]